MAKYGIFAMSALLAVGLALLVPLVVVYYMTQGLEVIAGMVIILIAVTGGVSAGVIGMGLHFATPFADNDAVVNTEEQLKILRASHRALLEEMDESIDILREIRDNLKEPGAGNP